MQKLDEKEFLRIVQDHQMKVIKDDGLYRHLFFGKPNTGCHSFGIVTWPGYLCYYGDMGDYLFQRIDDMFEFFRGREGKLEINPGYWSEKVEAYCSDGIEQYSPEKANQVLEEIVAKGDMSPEVEFAFRDEVFPYVNESEHELRRVVDDFSHDEFRVSDFWEYDLDEYTFRFLFCCYALVWGIGMYKKGWKNAEV